MIDNRSSTALVVTKGVRVISWEVNSSPNAEENQTPLTSGCCAVRKSFLIVLLSSSYSALDESSFSLYMRRQSSQHQWMSQLTWEYYCGGWGMVMWSLRVTISTEEAGTLSLLNGWENSNREKQTPDSWAKEMGVQWMVGLDFGVEKASRFAVTEALLPTSIPYLLKIAGKEHMLGLSFHL